MQRSNRNLADVQAENDVCAKSLIKKKIYELLILYKRQSLRETPINGKKKLLLIKASPMELKKNMAVITASGLIGKVINTIIYYLDC